MSRQTNLSRLLLKDVEGQLEQFERLWDGYAEEMNTESPHRQRTAVNKLLGYAMFLGMKIGKKDRSLRAMKQWQKRIGSLRDLDVTREWLAKCGEKAGESAAPAVAALDEQLLLRRRELLARVREDAGGSIGDRTRMAVQEVRRDFEKALGDSSGDHRVALRAVVTPWQEALAVLHEDHEDEVLHGFRVHNKRLRFVLEILAEEEKAKKAAKFGERAKVAAKVHTALGNLSDLKVLRDELRLARARWAEEKRELDEAAAALEGARVALEAAEFARWFSLWPVINDEAWLLGLL